MQIYCHPILKYLLFSIAIYLAITKVIDPSMDNQKALNLTGVAIFVYFLLDNLTYSPVMVPIVADVSKGDVSRDKMPPMSGDSPYDIQYMKRYQNIPPNVPPHLDTVDPAFPTSKFTYKSDGVLIEPPSNPHTYADFLKTQKMQMRVPTLSTTMSRKSGLTATFPEANEYPDYNQNMLLPQHDQNMNYFPGQYPIGGSPPSEIRLRQGYMDSDGGQPMDMPYSGNDAGMQQHMEFRSMMNQS